MTTLAVRARSRRSNAAHELLAQPAGRDVGEQHAANATREVAERIGAPLSAEQELALYRS